MENCFGLARNLGDALLASKESLRLKKANDDFENNQELKQKFEEYAAYKNNIQESSKNGLLSKEDLETAEKRLQFMYSELKKEDLINEIINSEEEFNFFVNQVLGIVKSTIMGEEKSSCSGSCSCGKK